MAVIGGTKFYGVRRGADGSEKEVEVEVEEVVVEEVP